MKLFKYVLIVFCIATCSASASEPLSTNELELKNAKLFDENTVTGGQPSKKDLLNLKSQGVNTIINLRGKGEFNEFDEAEEAAKLGLKYYLLPVEGSADVTSESAKALAKILAETNGKTLVHCASGNRVGALFALKAHFVDNKSADEALVIGEKAGLTRLKARVEEVLEKK